MTVFIIEKFLTYSEDGKKCNAFKGTALRSTLNYTFG